MSGQASSETLHPRLVGQSDFHSAAWTGNTELVRIWLENGKDVSEKHELTGCTALNLACQGRCKDTIQLLLEYGANPDIEDKNGDIAEDWISGNQELLDLLNSRSLLSLLTSGQSSSENNNISKQDKQKPQQTLSTESRS